MRGGWALQRRTSALAVAMVAASLLLAVTGLVAGGRAAGPDQWLLARVAELQQPALGLFFRVATWAGSFYLLGPAVLMGMLYLNARRERSAALVVGTGFYGAALATFVFKRVLDRERPVALDAAVGVLPPDPAFPSAHATHAVALALCLWWLARRYRPRQQMLVALTAGSAALVVALSRLYLQVHWPSDVAAGALVALGWCALVAALAESRSGSGGRST
ncbi:MAG TPA: phosphatase PAP2 family protein [Rhodocyclaceae bacterium]|nr:phosphatase PAP2 family protein [Rhodocyclaceae bacterium]